MSDAIIHKSAMRQFTQPIKQTPKYTNRTRDKITSSYRERYNSFTDHDLFQTKVETTIPRLYVYASTRELAKKTSVEGM